MPRLRDLIDPRNAASLSNAFRSKRFAAFEWLTSEMSRPLRIVDLGGTTTFWEQRGWAGREDIHITTVNLEAQPHKYGNILPIRGDVTQLKTIADRAFDIAFSNSVIEHLFTYEHQLAMANEVRRIASAYWVQTPNYWFPIEPHFHVPGWQWLPESLRIRIIKKHRCGWRGPCPEQDAAEKAVREVRLLTRRELIRLFPEADIMCEKFLGFVKSWILIHGFTCTVTSTAPPSIAAIIRRPRSLNVRQFTPDI